MTNNKQSSIEWFAQKLYETLEIKGDGYVIDSLLDLAKAMHKEEMIEFGELVWKNLLRSDKIMKPRDVYNETYGDDKQ
jgi:hypothetical protein